MKKLFVVLIVFAIVFAACDDESTSDNGVDDSSNKTTLTINNMSGYNLLNVEYASVEFGDINIGKDITNEVNHGTRYVVFYLYKNIEKSLCRITQALTCEEGKSNGLTITNNTIVTVIADNETDTLVNIKNLVSKYFKYGAIGPGGGIIYSISGNRYWEASHHLGVYNWNNAVTIAKNYRGGGFADWKLPDLNNDEAFNMVGNLISYGTSGVYYWTAREYSYNTAYIVWAVTDVTVNWEAQYKSDLYYVRVIRDSTF